MKYFLDTEFHEYHKKQLFGKPIPTIDLISIGIVGENTIEQHPTDKLSEPKSKLHIGKEYYAICKDFNLKDAWFSHQMEINKHFPLGPEYNKYHWLRYNVLKPIFDELLELESKSRKKQISILGIHDNDSTLLNFTYDNFKRLLKKHGKSKKEIAIEIRQYVYSPVFELEDGMQSLDVYVDEWLKNNTLEFYAYYADYDWVVFAQLFGKMMDLPPGFPMYCNDLKQMLDSKKDQYDLYTIGNTSMTIAALKDLPEYPTQENEHNALADAKWNKEFFNFINTLSEIDVDHVFLRRAGNSTRLIDKYIQTIFNNPNTAIKIIDHYPTKDADRLLFERIGARLLNEHHFLDDELDFRKSDLSIKFIKQT